MKVLFTAADSDAPPFGGSRIIYNKNSGKVYGLLRIARGMPGVSEGDAYIDFKEAPEDIAPLLHTGAFMKGSYLCAGWDPAPSRQVYNVSNLLPTTIAIKAPASSAESVLIEYYTVESFDETGILVSHYYDALDETRELKVKMTTDYMKTSGMYLVRVQHPEFGKLTLKVDMVVTEKPSRNAPANPVTALTDPEQLVSSVRDTEAYKSVIKATGKPTKDLGGSLGSLLEDALLNGRSVDADKIAQEINATIQDIGNKLPKEDLSNED